MDIERNIKPSKQIGRGRVERFPFSDMQVGDSLALHSQAQLKSARNAAYLYRKKHEATGWDYGSVKQGEGGRLWRIS